MSNKEDVLTGVAESADAVKFHSVTNARYTDADHDMISCMVVFPHIQAEPIPFVAARVDPSEHGRKLFQELIDGKHGPIGEPCRVTAKNRATTAAQANRAGQLDNTDKLVARHRDEKEVGGSTTLSDNQYSELQAYRAALRDWPESPTYPDGEPTAPAWL